MTTRLPRWTEAALFAIFFFACASTPKRAAEVATSSKPSAPAAKDASATPATTPVRASAPTSARVVDESATTRPVEADGAKSPAIAATHEERTGALQHDLDQSLTAFDEMLLREKAVLDKRAAEAAASAGQSGSGDSGSGDSGSGDSGSGDSGSGDSGSGETGAGDDGDEGATDGSAVDGGSAATSDAGSDATSSDAATESNGGAGLKRPAVKGSGSSAPADVRDGSHDDIVARQLREAAESEQDPALKAKLWDEYRRYKSGVVAAPTTRKEP